MTNPIVISLYSHKGGVGKTTTTREMAEVLARQFEVSVLLIDADPQCNLTNAVMLREFAERGARHGSTSSSSESNLTNIFTDEEMLAECVAQGEMLFRETPLEGGKVNTIGQVFNQYMSDITSPRHSAGIVALTEVQQIAQSDKLHILVGDLSLEQVEQEISGALIAPQQNGRNTPGAITKFFRDLAKKIGAEIVLVDLSPAISALNRVIIMGSDYVITPALPDYSSRSAIQSFATLLGRWDAEFARFRSTEQRTGENRQAPEAAFLLPEKPKYLGYIFQKVKITDIKEQRLPNAYRSGVWQLRRTVQQRLLPAFDVANRQPSFNLNALPVVKESNSYGLLCASAGVAMSYGATTDFALPKKGERQEKKRWTSSEKKAHQREVEEYRSRYTYSIIQLFGNMSDAHKERESIKRLLETGQPDKEFFRTQPTPTAHGNVSRRTTMFSPEGQRATALGKRNSQNSPYYRDGDQLFSAIPNGGAGNCAFEALGVSRATFLAAFEKIPRPNLSKALMKEMDSANREEGARRFAPPNEQELTELRRAKENAQTAYDNTARAIQQDSRIWGNVQITPPPGVTRHGAYINHLAGRFALYTADTSTVAEDTLLPRDIEEAQRRLENAQNEVVRADLAYKSWFEKPEVLTAYLDAMAQEGTWAGVDSIRVYARVTGQNIQIYQPTGTENADGSKMLRRYGQPNTSAPQGPVVNILYSGASHFERLEPALAPANESVPRIKRHK